MRFSDSFKKRFAFNEFVEMVDVDKLLPFREFNRDIDMENEYIAQLVESIKKEGIREELILGYNPNRETAVLTEGNHRLAIAKILGILQVPVRVIKNYNWHNVHVKVNPKIKPNRHGYVPSDLKPSDIGIE